MLRKYSKALTLLAVAATVIFATYLSFYYLNEYQIRSEEEAIQAEFNKRSEETEQWLSDMEELDKELRLRSSELLDSDRDLLKEIELMDAQLKPSEKQTQSGNERSL